MVKSLKLSQECSSKLHSFRVEFENLKLKRAKRQEEWVEKMAVLVREKRIKRVELENTLETSGEQLKNTLETSGEQLKNTLETGGEDVPKTPLKTSEEDLPKQTPLKTSVVFSPSHGGSILKKLLEDFDSD